MIPQMAKPRKHKRRSLWGVADVWNNNNGNRGTDTDEPGMVFCLVRNISVSGMGLFSVSPLKVGTSVTIRRLKLLENLVDNCIQGTVVWVNSRGNSYDIGISFSEDVDRKRYPEIYTALTRDRYNNVSISGIPSR